MTAKTDHSKPTMTIEERGNWLRGMAQGAGCDVRGSSPDSWPYIARKLREMGAGEHQVEQAVTYLGRAGRRVTLPELVIALAEVSPAKAHESCGICARTPGLIWAVVAVEGDVWEVLRGREWLATLDDYRGVEHPWARVNLAEATYALWAVPCTCPSGRAIALRDGWPAHGLKLLRPLAYGWPAHDEALATARTRRRHWKDAAGQWQSEYVQFTQVPAAVEHLALKWDHYAPAKHTEPVPIGKHYRKD